MAVLIRLTTPWLNRERKEASPASSGCPAGIPRLRLRQLTRRCGPLSEATTARIQALPLEQLEALAEALLDFSGPEELTTWLAANA